VPGFLGVRLFRACLEDERRYFILYRLAEPGVVASEAYLARLNAPTEWSSRVMPNLRNFVRAGGRVVAEVGLGHGGVVLPMPCASTDLVAASTDLRKIVAVDRVVSARLLEADRTGSSLPTKEKAMRTGDASFEALVLVEALDAEALTAGARAFSGAVESGSVAYDEVFALERSDLG
jgi:hypothetical protein